MMAIPGVRLIRWDKKNLIHGVYMTCTAMCGNGVRIGIMTVTTGRLQTGAPGLRLRAVPVFCGAGRGAPPRAAAVPPTAPGAALTTAATSSAFVWRAVFDAVFCYSVFCFLTGCRGEAPARVRFLVFKGASRSALTSLL